MFQQVQYNARKCVKLHIMHLRLHQGLTKDILDLQHHT